jgi:hypothetical protein
MRLSAAMLASTVLALSGCAGTDFVRPAEGELVIGKTTSADVSAKLGNPVQTGELTKNDQQLKVVRYAYAVSGGESGYEGVTPARSQSYFFFKDVLAGHQFVSSFKVDLTDFDGKKVASIVKGKSTRQDVVALLGKPSGEAVYPLIKGTQDRAFIYGYSQFKGTVFTPKMHSKTLLVSFDNAGIVTDVDYTVNGEQ